MSAAEVNIARPVVGHLRSLYGDEAVLTEVPFGVRRLDIVADLPDMLSIWECKTQLDDVVIRQATELQGVSDATSVVVPDPARRTDIFQFRMKALADKGIGLVLVDGTSWRQALHPATNRNAQPDMLREWVDRHRRAHIETEAGSKTAKTSDDSIAVAAIEKYLDEHGGVFLGRIYDDVPGIPASWKRNAIPEKVKRMKRDGAFGKGVELVTLGGKTELIKA